MKDTRFTATVRQEIEAHRLNGLYDRLENEETPFEMVVRRVDRHIRLVTICCHEQDKEHFKTMLYGHTH